VFLAQKPPAGAGRPDLAVDLIRRGIAENSQDWRLWSDLGFVYYWDMRDYQRAAEAYLEASRQPYAVPWVKPMAAQLAARGGSRDVSSFLWSEIYKSTPNELIRKNALEHLQTLKAEDDGERLENVIADFRKRFGRPPLSIWELVTAKLLPAYPADPAGFPYVLGPGAKPMLNPASPILSELLKPEALP
jgi:tetratricopeptide (TPR) repeat protein